MAHPKYRKDTQNSHQLYLKYHEDAHKNSLVQKLCSSSACSLSDSCHIPRGAPGNKDLFGWERDPLHQCSQCRDAICTRIKSDLHRPTEKRRPRSTAKMFCYSIISPVTTMFRYSIMAEHCPHNAKAVRTVSSVFTVEDSDPFDWCPGFYV